jgi:glycerol-1-phosphatase
VSDLLDLHDAALFDLDGTLFRGATAVPGAVDGVVEVARRGAAVGYLTNNGSRSADQVVEHLRELGFDAKPDEVVTSGQVAAGMLAERVAPGTPVLVVGTPSLAEEVIEVGLRVVSKAEDARAVIQGHSPETGWPLLAEACLAIRAGAVWVACNVDATLPNERGMLPGNGSMVAALRCATDVQPLVAGKPEAALFDEAVRRSGAQRPLVVGDRLDTDIIGANRVEIPALLVLTGVTDAAALLAADPDSRPTYVGSGLETLNTDAELARPGAQPGWRVERDGARLVLRGTGDGGPADPAAAVRALCAAHWAGAGGPADVHADGAEADAALRELGLIPSTGAANGG